MRLRQKTKPPAATAIEPTIITIGASMLEEPPPSPSTPLPTDVGLDELEVGSAVGVVVGTGDGVNEGASSCPAAACSDIASSAKTKTPMTNRRILITRTPFVNVKSNSSPKNWWAREESNLQPTGYEPQPR